MSKYKCVIFDCDGVLVDSEPISNRIMAEMANELGANIDTEYALKNFKGNSLEMCFQAIGKLAGQPIPSNFKNEYRRRSFEAFQEEIKPVDGIEEVLQNLKIPFCVASSGPVNKIELNLKLTGLLPYFKDKIFSCYTINKWKPDPAVFLWAAETLDFKPVDCLVVEDSILGVKAAKAGGFDCFGFSAHDYNNELEVESTLVFNDMKKLIDLIS